jgi:DNA-binding response OmpR family regulator
MASANRPKAAAEDRGTDARIRILLVDDSELSRDYVSLVLEQLAGVELLLASTGAAALRTITEGGISLVICDYDMPDMSGLQVLRFVRRTRSQIELPFLMLTGSEDPDVKVKAFRLGANDYIAKHAAPEELLARVGTQIDLLQANQRLNDARLRRAEHQKFETIGYLAQGLAHELNTPAQYIGDNLQFLTESFEAIAKVVEELRELSPAGDRERVEAALARADYAYLSEEVPRCIAESKQGIEHVAQIIQMMREFARPGLPERRPHSLNEIIRGALAVTRGQWHQLAELELELSEALPQVECVGVAIKQVVLYAILNAIKAMNRASLVDSRKNRLRIATGVDGDWALIEIEDTGRGMADALVQRVMAPVLSSIDSAEPSQALVHARAVVVDQHYGRLEVGSSAAGTTLSIRLPLDLHAREDEADTEDSATWTDRR